MNPLYAIDTSNLITNTMPDDNVKNGAKKKSAWLTTHIKNILEGKNCYEIKTIDKRASLLPYAHRLAPSYSYSSGHYSYVHLGLFQQTVD